MKHFIGIGNETPSEILDLLRANADNTSKQSYVRYFGEEEMKEKNELFIEKSMDLRRLNGELEDVKREFKAQIDPVKIEVNTLLTQLNDKGEQIINGEVFEIIDIEAKEVGTYGADGYLITSRPLKNNELANQTGIFSMNPKRNLLTRGSEAETDSEDKATGTDGGGIDFSFKSDTDTDKDDQPWRS